MYGVSDRDCGLDDDRRLRFPISCASLDESQYAFHSGAVKEVLLRIVISRSRDNDEVCIRIGSRTVCGGSQIKVPLTFFGLIQILLDVFVLDRGDEVVEFLDLLRYDINGGYLVVLRQKNCEGETNIACSGNSNLVGQFYNNRSGSGCIHKHIRGLEV